MKIVLASKNAHKIQEWNATLGKFVDGVEILSLDDIGFEGEIEEDGTTFEENAFLKASAAAKLGYFSIGEDSGLSVNALGGAPGIYSARYAGEHGNDAANNALLLKNLADKDDRSASFVCTIALIDPKEPTEGLYFRGETEGEILHEARGKGGFGYDPLFFYEPMGLSFSEMSSEQKNSISHRGKAIEKLAEYLKQNQR
ncbi:MAG: RdgB/HAM1 family non-canonical purine NTP pyrophosphatase [Clostridia bacterium]|nr:RdgB/HAM1 family non-canonical purine NTP pyrophosphatase [Clostridia bacterium]